MANKFDKIAGLYREKDGIRFVNADPATGTEGELIINRDDHSMKVYYNDTWQTLHALVGASNYLLLETGDYLLLETGDKLKLN